MPDILLKENLNLCFKGERDYIYASDVFAKTSDILKKHFPNKTIQHIDFSTHKKAHHDIEMLLVEQSENRKENLHAIYNFEVDAKKYSVQLQETDIEISCKTEYDEQSLFNSFELDTENKIITTNKQYDYSLMDVITSLNKMLLNNLFDENKKGWLSVRTKMDSLPLNNYEKLQVNFIKNFANRYFQSNIIIDNNVIGQIFFTTK